MSANAQVAPPAVTADVEVRLEIDPQTGHLAPTRFSIQKGQTVRFSSSMPFRVVFRSPFDTDGPEITASDVHTATVGGIFKYRCFITPTPGGPEIGYDGGEGEVLPHRP
jgi:hypothetical protein